MKELKNEFNKVWWNSLLTSIALIVIGILLMTYPTEILTAISMIIGIGIIVAGVFAFIRYFQNSKNEVMRNYFTFDLIYGVICLIAGSLLMINTKAIASILPLVLGIWMVINSVTKIQYALTIRQYNKESGLPTLILAILTLICGILFIFNPFRGMEVITQILGGIIAFYAVVDLVNAFLLKKRVRDFAGAVNEAENAIDRALSSADEDVKDAEIVDEKPKKKNTKKNTKKNK